MTLELTNYQASLIQVLIYNEIDRSGGINSLSPSVKAILAKIRKGKALKAL